MSFRGAPAEAMKHSSATIRDQSVAERSGAVSLPNCRGTLRYARNDNCFYNYKADSNREVNKYLLSAARGFYL